jgi:DNA-binding protein HU-beta
MTTINKKELIEHASEVTGISKSAITNVVDTIIDAIITTVAKDGKVNISGFGNFYASNREARVGRNPSSGMEVKIPATRLPKFKISNNFKEAVKGHKAIAK